MASLGNPKTTTTAQSNAPAGTGTGKKAGYGEMLEYSQCVRSHGVPGFPDPTFQNSSVQVNVPSTINQNSSQFMSAATVCTKLIPAGLPYTRPSGS